MSRACVGDGIGETDLPSDYAWVGQKPERG
jgi:hypothetical protein